MCQLAVVESNVLLFKKQGNNKHLSLGKCQLPLNVVKSVKLLYVVAKPSLHPDRSTDQAPGQNIC